MKDKIENAVKEESLKNHNNTIDNSMKYLLQDMLEKDDKKLVLE